MPGFADRVGAGGRTFGRNLHRARPNVTTVLSELTGVPTGRIVEHGDGRVDAHHRGDRGVTVTAEQVHGSLTEGRKWLYAVLREQGFTHDQALRRMTRERS